MITKSSREEVKAEAGVAVTNIAVAERQRVPGEVLEVDHHQLAPSLQRDTLPPSLRESANFSS